MARAMSFAAVAYACCWAHIGTVAAAADAPPSMWAATWLASPAFAIGPEFDHQTVRQTLRLSLGGNRIRIRFANENSANPVVLGAVHVATPGAALGSIDASTDHVMTFNGARSVTVPAGAPVYSDPVDFKLAALSSVTISMYLTRHTGPSTIHPDANATAFISSEGDHTADTIMPDATTSTARILLSEVDVASSVQSYTVVTLGDSITDGAGSSLDQNHRWPDYLAARLATNSQTATIGVGNAGIDGNRVLHDLPEPIYGPNILARLDRDVLSVPGLRWVIQLIGINDIGHPTASGLPEQAVSAQQLIAGLQQIVERVHGRGAKVIGATLLPFEGAIYSNFYTDEGEQKRQSVNAWIRSSGTYDAVIDFDHLMGDPTHPGHLSADYDSGDHLHPNDAGYRKMAEAVDLALFRSNSR